MAAAQPTPASDVARLEAERQRLIAALALAERDRQLLGYEIHDRLVQNLTAAAMLMEGTGAQSAFTSPEAQENYATGLRLLRESIAAARQLIDGLHPPSEGDGDLPMALCRLVEKFRTDLRMPIAFECRADDLRLPPAAQQLLLRIAQEALFNIWKHAQASQVVLTLAESKGELTLSIADDGVGFDANQIPAGHFGIEGIRERAQILGAQLNIKSSPVRGTNIEVRLTLSPGVHHA